MKQKDNMHYGQRPIRSILDKEQLENPYGQFQVRLYVDDGGEFIDVGQRMEGDVVPLNMNSFRSEEAYNTGRTRKGSVWIMTKEADGSIYHKGARIASFTNEYYQGHLQSGNAYISGIRGAVLQMINSNGNMDKIKSALHDIQKYLYFTKEHNVLIRPTKKGNFFIINSATKSMAIKLTQNSFDEIMNALLGERFKFAIGATTLKEIVDSDILYTDLAELHNKNASFAISRLVDGQPQKSQFFANNTVREEKGKPKGSPQSQNGNTYHVYANGKPTEYKVFYSDGRIVRVADNRTPTNKALIAVLSDVYGMETSENGLQADDRFRLFNSNYRNVYITQYDDNGQTRNIAYMVTKSSSGRVSISAFTDPQTDFINGVVNGTVTIDSTNSHIYREICDKIGKKMNEKEFSQAASGGAGVDENATQGKQVVPKYAVQYPELMDYRFKIGDEVSFRMGEAQLSGIVTAVKEDGSFSVKVNGKRNDIYIHPYATYAFFNKPYGSSSAT